MNTHEQQHMYQLLVRQAANAEMRASQLRELAREISYLKRKLSSNEALRIDQQARMIQLTSTCPWCKHV